jgi:hypothetical protein
LCKGELYRSTKFMFVVTWVSFDGGMGSRKPPAAHGADSGILGENFGQGVRELTAHCGNIVFGAHGPPPTLIGPAMANRLCSDGFQARSARI